MRIRGLSFLTALALVVALLTSCAMKDTRDESFDELYAAISEYEDMIARQESSRAEDNSKERFVVVIPVGCGADIFDSAAFLSRTLSKYVGYEVETYYDSDLKEKSTNIEVLVGATDRDKSVRYMKELRADDYGYKYSDGAILIGAHTDEGIASAVGAFVDSVVSGDISPTFAKAIKPFSVNGEYAINTVKLCGFELCEYAIVYPEKNTNHELTLAKRLRDMLAEYSGYCLPIVSDKRASESVRAICVGESSLTSSSSGVSEALITVSHTGNIELLADENYGIALAAEKLLQIIKDSESFGECNVTLSGTRKYSYSNEEISLYIVRDDFVSGSLDSYVSAVRGVRANTISVFDRLSASVITNLRNNLGSLWGVRENSFYYCDQSKMRCIFADSEAMGGGEILTLVMERSDGERIAFVGGFCEKDASEKNDAAFCERLIEECRKYEDIPLIVAHEMTEARDREFADASPRLEAVDGASGIYYSSDLLSLERRTTSRIDYALVADVVRVKLCYK